MSDKYLTLADKLEKYAGPLSVDWYARESSAAIRELQADNTRLRKAIEDFVNTDYEDMTIESIQSDMRKAIGE
jgi:hypothetical protein